MSIYLRPKPWSKDAAKYPWIVDCDRRDCYYIVSSDSEYRAEITLKIHQERTCPMTLQTNEFVQGEYDANGQPYTRPNLGKSVAEKLWDELDGVMDSIKATVGPENANELKFYARGLSFAIQLVCQPYYADVTAVAHEAAKRWRIRHQQQLFEPTPGYQFNPPPPGTTAYAKGIAQEDTPQVTPTKTRTTRSKAKSSQLTDQEMTAIRTMAGQFPVEQIAGIYKISVERVKEIQAS